VKTLTSKFKPIALIKLSFLLLLPAFCVALHVAAQTGDTVKLKQESFSNYSDLREKQKKAGIDKLIYKNFTFSFSVAIPNWLNLKETGSDDQWGGTLPPIDGIENAIMIKAFPKSAFKSFSEFETIYLTGNKFGQPAKYDSQHTWYGQHELIPIAHGVKQKVFLVWQKKIYDNMFVLLETKSAYLWIQFVATRETYDRNISKFDEFMAGVNLME